ncbi:hypothetical protein [uncultured Sphingosinicella sp.]|uniref:hypothetical protein n=1 Tax=uncultured Sphingosinicella sp. TaxID=478748 RepID=UPI0030DD38ED
MPQTAAGIERRLALLDMVVRDFPGVAWRICVAQDGSHPRFATRNSSPKWRTDAAGVSRDSFDSHEDYLMHRHALDVMLDWPLLDRSRLANLIGLSTYLVDEDQEKLWASVRQWIDSKPDDAERAVLHEHRRISVFSRYAWKKAKAESDNWAGTRHDIYDALAPRDPVARHRWLFAEHFVTEAGDEILEEDLDCSKASPRCGIARPSGMTRTTLSATGLGEGDGRRRRPFNHASMLGVPLAT